MAFKRNKFICRIGFWLLFVNILTVGHDACGAPLAVGDLSDKPTDEQIGQVRIFSIPFVAESKANEDNAELSAALRSYGLTKDLSAIQKFVEDNPRSKWNIALLANLGQERFLAGEFELAMAAWQQAWDLGKEKTDTNIKALVDQSIGELAKMNARVGRMEKIEAILNELKGRGLSGASTELVAGAAEGLWLMRNQPERAFLCGPAAIRTLYALKPGVRGKAIPADFENFQSTVSGTSLSQIGKLAVAVGLDYQMAWKEPKASFILPSVANWKLGHWAALTKRIDGKVLVDDPTFGQRLWIKEAILDEETTGYFLVPKGPLPKGWRIVDAEEGDRIWGKGTTGSTDPDPCKPCDEKASAACAGCGEGAGGSAAGYAMAVATGHLAVVSLNIVDTPLFYTPPRGPSVHFRVTYNQRDAGQAPSFYYSNLGPKWTFDWISFIEDDPTSPYSDVKLYVRGGGVERFYFDYYANRFDPSLYTQSTLTKTLAGYELTHKDGSVDIYSVSDGATSSTRRIFLSKSIDPQGNFLKFNYDANLRLTSMEDALGRPTTIAYAQPGDIWKITSVTDPFGRTATFDYTNGRLTKITDMAGITSQFTYAATGPDSDFITSLTTPYGVSTFDYGDYLKDSSLESRTRWLEMTDPMGGKERIEYNELDYQTNVSDFTPSNHSTVIAGVVPKNMYNRNSVMYARNTFYWSKKATMDAPGDYSSAKVYHWLHYDGLSKSGAILESEKQPLENRIWYNYPGQAIYPGDGPPIYDSSATETGSSNLPTIIGRVLDDGTTQTYKRQYNSMGMATKEIDPKKRIKTYQYAANNIDLLGIYQQNPAGASTDPVDGVPADKLISYSNYNALHEPQTVVDVAGRTTTYTYNAQGQKTTQTVTRNGVNETTTWNYLGGYLMSVTGPAAGATTSYTYDSAGRLKTVTQSDGYKLIYAYDALNRLVRTTYPDGTYTQTLYDRLDPAWQRDRLGRWAHRVYDNVRRLATVTDPENHTTQYDWCACGSLKGIYDANNNYTSFTQDIQGRLKTKTYMDGKGLVYVYENTTSRLASIQDAKNQKTKYLYNVDNTLQQVSYTNLSNQPLVPPTPTISYAYDSVYSRLASLTDGTGLTQYNYKPVGNFGANQVNTVDGPLVNDTIAYTYDELGRALSAKVNGTGNTVTYDALGRVVTAVNPLGAFTYHYIGQTSRLDDVDRPGGQKVDYSYFGNTGDDRLSEIKNLGPSAAALSKFNYTYDPVGNIRAWTQQVGTGGSQYYDLGYNRADELLSAPLRDAATGAMIKPYTYRYDAAGNRTSEQVDNGVTTAGYNNLNQLKTIAPGGALTLEGDTGVEPALVTVGGNPVAEDANNRFKATVTVTSGTNAIPITATDGSGNSTSRTAQINVSALTGATLDYDLNGSLTWDGTKGYEWDAANRLVAITYGSPYTSRTEFTYDGLGRRTQIVEKTGSTINSTKKFVWIGNNLAEEREGNNNVTKRFYGEGEQIGATSYLFTKDHLGSIREMVDMSGVVQARYAYDPYGRRTKISGSLEADFGYTGHYYHAPSSLHLALYRAYDANKGRWLSRDPLGSGIAFLSINPSQFKAEVSIGEFVVSPNLYRYVKYNPVVNVDFYGLLTAGSLSPSGAEAIAAIAADAAGESAGVGVGEGALAAAAAEKSCPDPKCKKTSEVGRDGKLPHGSVICNYDCNGKSGYKVVGAGEACPENPGEKDLEMN